MEKINQVLIKYGSKLSDLSDGVKAQVMELQETIKKYDAALDVYESSDEKDADVDAQLEAMEKYIDENEEVLSNNIEAELAEKARVEKEAEQKKAELAEKARVEEEAEQKKAELEKEAKAAELKVDAPPTEPEKNKEEKKEGSAFGWIIAGVAAAVGLGFLFKNKG